MSDEPQASLSATTAGLIATLAVPRLHGTASASLVEGAVRTRLELAGWRVEAWPFEFSAWPGRHAAQAAGFAVLATMLGTLLLLVADFAGIATLLLAIPIILVIVALLLADTLIMRAPLARSRGTNLYATATGASPRFLFVAHRDSKSQGVPLVLRIGGVILSLAAWLALLASAVLMPDAMPLAAVVTIALSGMIGGAMLMACSVGNDSPGALDNASGLAALLRIAEQERGAADVAFLVTDAEELGLAGARSVARRLDDIVAFEHLEAVINFDGLDDHGPFFIVEGRPPWILPPPCSAACAMRDVGRDSRIDVRRRGVPPGLLLDHIPFARAGVPAMTLMRGSIRSLARVHRSADRSDRLSGEGAEYGARIALATLARMRAAPRAERVARRSAMD